MADLIYSHCRDFLLLFSATVQCAHFQETLVKTPKNLVASKATSYRGCFLFWIAVGFGGAELTEFRSKTIEVGGKLAVCVCVGKCSSTFCNSQAASFPFLILLPTTGIWSKASRKHELLSMSGQKVQFGKTLPTNGKLAACELNLTGRTRCPLHAYTHVIRIHNHYYLALAVELVTVRLRFFFFF